MASPAQILANRENAKHSTGPKTESGKAASKLNAFRHGLTSETLVLSPEDAESYERFSAALLTELAPAGPLEEQLAQTIVHTDWRLNKIPALEANLFALARLQPPPEHIEAIADPLVKNALLDAHGLIVYERQFRNLHIQEQRLHRVLRQATQELSVLQQARCLREQNDRLRAALKAKKEQERENPQPTAEPVAHPDGFVFSQAAASGQQPDLQANPVEPSRHASEKNR